MTVTGSGTAPTGPAGFRGLLEQGRGLVAVGAHNALSARLGEAAGFDLVWGSGFEIAAAHGSRTRTC